MNNTTDNNLSQQDAGNSRASFASTDWLGEVEAALSHLRDAENSFDRGMDAEAEGHMNRAKKVLVRLYDSNRPSPSGALNSRGKES